MELGHFDAFIGGSVFSRRVKSYLKQKPVSSSFMALILKHIYRLSAPICAAIALQEYIAKKNHKQLLMVPITITSCDSISSNDKPKPPNDYIIVHPEFNYEEGDSDIEYALKFEDGTMYQGETLHDQMHGTGRLKLSDGTIYVGNFVHGQPEGEGTIIGEHSVYAGEIKDWLPHGRGTMTDAAGTVCEGRFYRGELNGHGTLTEIDGSVYDGMFEYNSPNGHGKYTCSDYVCEGVFENFVLKEGTIVYTIGGTDQGIFIDNKLNGWGKSVWKDGTTVEGEYVNGEATGVVTVTRGGVASTLVADGVQFKYYKLCRYLDI